MIGQNYIALNDDDDNANGTADPSETGTVTGENDLVKITLWYTPGTNVGPSG